jgi:pyruvate-ferredoxin/flavodoxin oxidoreductase
MRLTVDKQNEYARELLTAQADMIGAELVKDILEADQADEAGIQAQRARIDTLKERLTGKDNPKAKDLLGLADILVEKSVWIIGGDGWAYDIGYGGLDHVLASGRNVNILVMDTQVYSNTGGQSSKATPIGAVAKFAAEGKEIARKDLGMIAMSYGYVYVAQIAMGASDMQTLRAIREADAFDGPSLIIAYSHCIAHGYDMKDGLTQQKLLVKSGLWPLYRYNPENTKKGKNPLKLDSKAPSIPISDFAYNEARFRVLTQNDESRAETLMKSAEKDAHARWNLYEQMAKMNYEKDEE